MFENLVFQHNFHYRLHVFPQKLFVHKFIILKALNQNIVNCDRVKIATVRDNLSLC